MNAATLRAAALRDASEEIGPGRFSRICENPKRNKSVLFPVDFNPTTSHHFPAA